MDRKSNKRVILPLDDMSGPMALEITGHLGSELAGVKVGFELFIAEGPDIVRKLSAICPVFLDLKLKDIPQTVAKAVTRIVGLGPVMCNVHVDGGSKMMRVAVESAGPVMKVLGVTVLTSLDGNDLYEIDGAFWQQPPDPSIVVLNRAVLAYASGLHGVIASPQEASEIRAKCGPEFWIVTPGIRAKDAKPDDQKRTATAGEAIEAGSDFLVIGRPITKASAPLEALEGFNAEVTETLGKKAGVAV